MTSKHKLLALIITIADKRTTPPELDARITRAAKDAAYYESALTRAVELRYNQETTDEEFLTAATFLILSELRRAYREGLREVGIATWDLEFENDLDPILQKEQEGLRKLLQDIKNAILLGLGLSSLLWRIALWANRYEDVKNRAKVTGGKKNNISLVWTLGATEKHCKDCLSYAGQVKTAQEWDDIYRLLGHKPQSHELQCKGFNCDCRLEVT